MKSFQEIYIKSNSLSAVQIIDSVISLCNENSEWGYLPEESDEYAKNIGEPGCIILFKSLTNSESFSVAIAKKNEHMLYVTNIIHADKSSLTLDEYNTFARTFANAFKRFVKSKKHEISILISKDSIGIDSIFSSPIAQKFFTHFLNAFPRSYHPLDIERLDKFTCALSKYGRKSPDFDGFQRYLLEDLKWPEEDASWCRNRVQIGYEVLEVNKGFF
jgi:hypothetical protein